MVSRPEAQILVNAIGIHNLARIHFSRRVPNRLKLPERLDQFLTKHFGQQFPARLPVAMFTGERTAVADHQVGGVLHERAEVPDAFCSSEVEIDADMDATFAKMAVQSASVTIALEKPPKVPQI